MRPAWLMNVREILVFVLSPVVFHVWEETSVAHQPLVISERPSFSFLLAAMQKEKENHLPEEGQGF